MLLDEGDISMMSTTTTHVGLTQTPTSAGAAGSAATAVVMSPADYAQEPPDTKEGIEELCPVCGDKVSGYHYGLLTCESCKGFFKRTVQNKKVYTCVAERSCHIDKSQRKRCPYCRFQKCLDVGMKLEAVRADRMRGGRNKFGPMYKRDRARKLQLLRQKQMASVQGRPQCQMGSEVVGSIAAAGASSMPYSPTTAPGTPLYGSAGGNGVQIKQELIQIPQLSSSTSSPDSSPSPLPSSGLCGPAGSAMSNGPMTAATIAVIHSSPPPGTPHHPPHPHHSHQTQSQTPSAQAPSEHPKMSWTPHTPTTPTSSTPSPHTASPKAFQYEVTASQGTAASASSAAAAAATAAGTMVAKLPTLIHDIQTSVMDDKEWESQLFGLLQNQTYNQCEVDLFELMCKVLDQSLFAQVDWARNSLFFKDLKVDDQMKLLQYSWSDMLILDHVHHRLHNNLPDEMSLPNGQKFDLLELAVLGLPSLVDQFNDLSTKLQELKFDSIDYICLKFLLLLNPGLSDVRALVNRKHIHEALEQVKQALLEYNLNFYPEIKDKFDKLLGIMQDIHMLSLRGEEYLYYKHLGGGAPTQTLLMEMLHAKKK